MDDIALVIHADPPVEHKAYLHRSGRTARAGAEGIVITLMTDDQVGDVRDLTRKAGIKATTTRLDASHSLLSELAPGERTFTEPLVLASDDGKAPRRTAGARGGRPGAARSSGGRATGGRATGGRGGAPRGGSVRNTASGAGSTRGGATGGTAKGSSGAKRSSARGAGRSGGQGGGSTSVYSTSSSRGGAAAFSAGSSLGRR